MATRRIPISSSSTNSRRASQPAADPPTRYASSLDAVFSFQRSAAFFQDNLQSGPSFVDCEHYPRPFDDDDDEDDAARYSGGDEDETSESVDQDERGGDTSASPRDAVAGTQESALGGSGVTGYDSQDSDSGPPSGLLVDTATTKSAGHDALPPNALARYSRSGQQRRRAGEETTAEAGEATEHSPLLARPRTRSRSRHNRNGDMFQVGGDTTTSSDYLSTKAGDSSGLYSHGHGHAGSRRASVFSREVWKAKIEAHRGESTWGQTLFNT
jgi:hypothetical protein